MKKYLLIICFFLILAGCDKNNNNSNEEYSLKEDVKYTTKQGSAGLMFNQVLEAEVNGKIYRLISESEGVCMDINQVKDFDMDGYPDVLICHIQACGGNGAENSYFFYSYNGNGSFSKSEEFGYTFKEPIIEKWHEKNSVVVLTQNIGMNTEEAKEVRERYILQKGIAVKVESFERKPLVSEIEMVSGQLIDGDKKISFDLDNDGRKDIIKGSLWERWGVINWVVNFANGKKYEGQSKRIGILKTKTNGVYDLVGDFDDTYKWDGSTYKYYGQQ